MSGIVVSDLGLSFGAARVLKGLNLEVADGEFLVLLGASGCGKSTLLNCVAGLLEPDDGQIFIGGRNVTWEEPSKRGVGMVFQSYALYPQMTARGNMSFGLRHARVPKDEIARRVARAAETLQITPLLDRKPAALSGGQRQRVAIGRALVRDADVFLFDEPLSNLDAKLRRDLRVEIKRLHRALKSTMIYVTHDQVEAMTLADRIAVMRGGEILQIGSPGEIYSRPDNVFVAAFVGSPAMNFIPVVVVRENGAARARMEDPSDPSGAQVLNLPPQAAGNAPPGPALMGVRPEHLTAPAHPAHPALGASDAQTLRVRVELTEPSGAENYVIADLAGTSVTARLAEGRSVRSGETTELACDAARVLLFDPETERRIN